MRLYKCACGCNSENESINENDNIKSECGCKSGSTKDTIDNSGFTIFAEDLNIEAESQSGCKCGGKC